MKQTWSWDYVERRNHEELLDYVWLFSSENSISLFDSICAILIHISDCRKQHVEEPQQVSLLIDENT